MTNALLKIRIPYLVPQALIVVATMNFHLFQLPQPAILQRSLVFRQSCPLFVVKKNLSVKSVKSFNINSLCICFNLSYSILSPLIIEVIEIEIVIVVGKFLKEGPNQ